MQDHAALVPRFHARAVLLAAVAAGAVFMVRESIIVPAFMDGATWAPPRMIAAIGMGTSVLPPPATFDAVIMLVAMMIHFGLSMSLALLFSFIARGRAPGVAIGLGAVFGLVVYLIGFHGMTAVFPWFAMARGWVAILAHLAYGAALGWVYVSVAQKAEAGMTPARKEAPAAA